MIKCGHCGGAHGTVAQVRKCSEDQRLVPSTFRDRSWGGRGFTEQDERDMQRMEAEGDRAESRRDAAAKAAKWDAEATSFPVQMRNQEPSELIAIVDRMLVTREIPEADHRWSRAVRALISGESGAVTEFALRNAISRLMGYPKRLNAPEEAPRTEATKPEREGLYRLRRDVKVGPRTYQRGMLFQVVRNQKGDRIYAKLVTFRGEGERPVLTYVAGMIMKLRADELVPVEEAQEITRKTGWCVFGHFLTNPVSIARGMGPKCYERYPHLARNAA